MIDGNELYLQLPWLGFDQAEAGELDVLGQRVLAQRGGWPRDFDGSLLGGWGGRLGTPGESQ
jgi:hypothetical protein